MQEISWLTKQLLVSQEELCSMELVGCSNEYFPGLIPFEEVFNLAWYRNILLLSFH